MTLVGTLLALPFGPELLFVALFAFLVLPFIAVVKLLALVRDAADDDSTRE